MITPKQKKENSIEKSSVKSGVSDYLIFAIGLLLVLLSNFSDLNQMDNTRENIVKEQNSSGGSFIIANDLSGIKR